MAKKSVLRRHSKWLPASAELRQALAVDDREYEHEPKRLDISTLDIDALPPVAITAEQKEVEQLRETLSERKIAWLSDDRVEDLRERLVEADAISKEV